MVLSPLVQVADFAFLALEPNSVFSLTGAESEIEIENVCQKSLRTH